jgi:hydrogenase-4 component B
MNAVIDAFGLVAVPALPLLIILLWCVPGFRPRIACWTPWAALPALLLASGGEAGAFARLDWLLFGTVLGLNELNRVFLAFTAMLWLAAGFYARGYMAGDARGESFRLLWLAAMSGNFGLILALDVASFYASFALMTFAAYGLVIHAHSAEALRAGRVYLVMAIVGEALILTGLLLAAGGSAAPILPMLAELPDAIAASARRDLIIACLFLGFGVKAGVPLLHMWLPLAHPVAPIPASAVLSGAMIKAGLLGWLTTLPLGVASLPWWSAVIMIAGLIAAFGGALVGVHQRTPKTVLAYSSISQMGLITVGVGAGLQAPALWPALAPAVALYALHHGLAKGALFLGVGIARHSGGHIGRPWLWIALALPGLSLAGLMSSGIAAKLTLKQTLAAAETPAWWDHLPWLMGLAAIGTAALVLRYLWLLRGQDQGDRASRSVWLGWAMLLVAGSLSVFALPAIGIEAEWIASMADLVGLVWPVLIGLALAELARKHLRPLPIPSGDVLAWFIAAGQLAGRSLRRLPAGARRVWTRILRSGHGIRRRAAHRNGYGTHAERFWRRESAMVFVALLVAVTLASLAFAS